MKRLLILLVMLGLFVLSSLGGKTSVRASDHGPYTCDTCMDDAITFCLVNSLPYPGLDIEDCIDIYRVGNCSPCLYSKAPSPACATQAKPKK